MKQGIYIALILLTACLSPDEKVEAPTEVMMEVSQSTATPFNYLNLVNKTNSYQFNNKLWHLKFQSNAFEWAVFLNPLIDISVHKTSETDFEAVNADYVVNNVIEWQKDVPLKTSMLPAIGTWGDYSFDYPKSFNTVYILKIKHDLQLEYVKIQILDAVKNNYNLRYSKLGTDDPQSILIPKEKEYTHTYFSVDGLPEVIRVEPKRDDWQVCFSYGFDSTAGKYNRRVIKQITDSIGLYPKIILNKQAVNLHIDSITRFREIDYFYAKEQEYIAYEQIINPFILFDPQNLVYYVDDRIVLLCKVGDIYIKLKATELEYTAPAGFKLNLVAESL